MKKIIIQFLSFKNVVRKHTKKIYEEEQIP